MADDATTTKEEQPVTNNRFTSRKFLVSVGTMVVTLVSGFGYDLDPKVVAQLTAAEGGLYLLIEGLIDLIRAWKGIEK